MFYSYRAFFQYTLPYLGAFAKMCISLSLKQPPSLFVFFTHYHSSQLRQHFLGKPSRTLAALDYFLQSSCLLGKNNLLVQKIYLCHDLINVCLLSGLSSSRAGTMAVFTDCCIPRAPNMIQGHRIHSLNQSPSFYT